MKKTKKKTAHSSQKVTLESLLKQHPIAVERLSRVSRFPLQDPFELIVETTDWRIERRTPKQYPGAASFSLTSEN